MTWYVFFVFLHVLSGFLAFGTAMLAFPVIGAFGGKEPAHVNFALRLNYALGRRAVTPIGLATFVLGVIAVIVGDWNVPANEWLWISIVLFVIAFSIAQFVTLPTVGRLVQLTSAPPPPGATGPPPEVMKLVQRTRIAGIVTGLMIATIILLMIWKPGTAV